VSVEIDYFLPQLPIKTRHHGNNENENGHPEEDSQDGDERNDGEKSALRFQIAQRQEKAEWQAQSG